MPQIAVAAYGFDAEQIVAIHAAGLHNPSIHGGQHTHVGLAAANTECGAIDLEADAGRRKLDGIGPAEQAPPRSLRPMVTVPSDSGRAQVWPRW
jgi:hypothetical protein